MTDTDGSSSPEERAWHAAHLRYGSVVWACIRKFKLPESDAEDLYQNTWIVALRRSRFPPPDTDIVRYLASIAHWEVRALFKLKRRKLQTLSHDIVDDEDGLAERLVIEAEEAQIVIDCLQTLPARYRAILEALFVDGLSYRETADRLGIGIEGVGPLRQRALRRLKACLRPQGVE